MWSFNAIETLQCYIIAESQDELQWLLYKFYEETKKCNNKISTEKTMFITNTKEPMSCPLEAEVKMIEQVI